MTNNQIIHSFLTSTKEAKANHITTHYNNHADEMLLRQYGTLIATREGNVVTITHKKFSQTTTILENKITSEAKKLGLKVVKSEVFTKDKVFTKGDIAVQRIGGSDMWSVAIKGKSVGRVLGAILPETALKKAEKEFKDKYAKGGGVDGIRPSTEITNLKNTIHYQLSKNKISEEEFDKKLSKLEKKAYEDFYTKIMKRGYSENKAEKIASKLANNWTYFSFAKRGVVESKKTWLDGIEYLFNL